MVFAGADYIGLSGPASRAMFARTGKVSQAYKVFPLDRRGLLF